MCFGRELSLPTRPAVSREIASGGIRSGRSTWWPQFESSPRDAGCGGCLSCSGLYVEHPKRRHFDPERCASTFGIACASRQERVQTGFQPAIKITVSLSKTHLSGLPRIIVALPAGGSPGRSSGTSAPPDQRRTSPLMAGQHSHRCPCQLANLYPLTGEPGEAMVNPIQWVSVTETVILFAGMPASSRVCSASPHITKLRRTTELKVRVDV